MSDTPAAVSSWSDAVRLGVGTLTVWPTRPPRVVDRRAGGRAMLLAPAIGAGLGAVAACVAWAGGALGLSGPLTAALVLAALAAATGGLHLDGLADTADGLAASADRERALAVMRQGDVGPLGAATVIIVLLIQVTAMAQVITGSGPVAVAVAVAAARLALPVGCRRGVPTARPDGLGAMVGGTVPGLGVALAGGLLTVAAGAVLLWARVPPWRAAGAVLVVIVVTVALTHRTTRRLGGITGDVLGAAVELATAAALVALVALAR